MPGGESIQVRNVGLSTTGIGEINEQRVTDFFSAKGCGPMLTVRAWNDGTGDSTTDNYRVWVYVNRRVIWSGFVSGHDRTKGWTQLLRDIADKAEKIETFSLDEPEMHQKEGVNG